MEVTPRAAALWIVFVIAPLMTACLVQCQRQSQDPILREAAGDPPKRMRLVESGGTRHWYQIWEDTETGAEYLETGHGTVKLDP